ncbi:MAG: 4Fe-4S binding protein [Chloroflexi bacterium]|nr:4Fe-4S binding protein [Chloroflexota bacterium]
MYRVDAATCTGCGDCVEACPAGAIALVAGRAHIAEARCTGCGSCADACPQGAIVMADAVNPAYAVIKPGASMLAVVPAAPSVEAASFTHWPAAEVLPAVTWRRRLWPMIGGALVWATRELLPEVIAAWRASHAGVSQPISFKPDASVRRTSTARRNGHRYRWGRA